MNDFGSNEQRVLAFLQELAYLGPEDVLALAGFWRPDETRRQLAWRHVERLRTGAMEDAWERACRAAEQWAREASSVRSLRLPFGAAPVGGAGREYENALPAVIDVVTAYVFERRLLPFEVAALLAPWHAIRGTVSART